jgi:hypothetical protein
MNGILELVRNGTAINVAIILTAIEILVLVLILRRRSWPILLGIAPGVCLMFSLAAAIAQNWAMVGLWLTAALPLHLADLRSRF